SAGPAVASVRSGDAVGLDVRELVHARSAELASDAGALRAAERDLDRRAEVPVDADGAGVKPPGHPAGLIEVLAVDGAAEPVLRAVGERDRRVGVGHPVDHADRTE